MYNNYVKHLDMVNINDTREQIISASRDRLACESTFISATYGSQGQCGRKYPKGVHKTISFLDLRFSRVLL
jgi:hypothetical protein